MTIAILWSLIVIAGGIHAVNPVVWILENVLIFGGALWLLITRKSRPLSRFGYACCTLFVALHEVGAHYTYRRVPLGYWLQSQFGLVRNDYDRIVHFAFGLLFTVAVWESFERNIRGSLFALYVLSFSVVMWFSALYEISEAYVIMLAPGPGTIFLATQGDLFDSQNDMACALAGCLLCLAGIAGAQYFRRLERQKRNAGNPAGSVSDSDRDRDHG